MWGLHSHDPINPNYLPNIPCPNTTILSFMVWIFQGDTIQPITPCDITVLKLLCYAQSCSTLCDPLDCSPWNSPGKNTGTGCHFLLQEIFPTQGVNPHLLYWQADSLPLRHLGSPQTWRTFSIYVIPWFLFVSTFPIPRVINSVSEAMLGTFSWASIRHRIS